MLSRPPDVQAASGDSVLKSWTGTSPVMVQPRLDQHYVVMHLGGAKRVTRRGHGKTLVREVEEGALTLVPAGARFDWVTEGPIAFAHLYLAPGTLDNAVAAVAGRDPRTVSLRDEVGLVDPVLVPQMRGLLQMAAEGGDGLRFETGLTLLLASLVARGTTAGSMADGPIRLTRARLRRVLDHIEAGLGEELALDGLAEVAGLSKFHFARAFKAETGHTPHAYVMARRMQLARRLLVGTGRSVDEVAQACGYQSHSRFSASFRTMVGVSPSVYRRG